ncbi:hypothetical protein CEN49_21665, partial [Fischerella thermalis CCMEE 5273]
ISQMKRREKIQYGGDYSKNFVLWVLESRVLFYMDGQSRRLLVRHDTCTILSALWHSSFGPSIEF